MIVRIESEEEDSGRARLMTLKRGKVGDGIRGSGKRRLGRKPRTTVRGEGGASSDTSQATLLYRLRRLPQWQEKRNGTHWRES